MFLPLSLFFIFIIAIANYADKDKRRRNMKKTRKRNLGVIWCYKMGVKGEFRVLGGAMVCPWCPVTHRS